MAEDTPAPAVSAEARRPPKLTKLMVDALRYLEKRGVVTKSMMDSYGPRLGTYEALFNRGLAHRPPIVGPFTLTDAGRAALAAQEKPDAES